VFNVCPQCGEYSVEKTIDPSGPFAICPFCHYAHPFLQQPLLIITGPSGVGKTTICLKLVPLLKECVVMESDILWGAFPATPENNYRDYRNMWLRIAKNIGQAGRPVVLCGTALPEQFEQCRNVATSRRCTTSLQSRPGYPTQMSHCRQNQLLTSFFHSAISTTFAKNQSSKVYRLLQ